MNYLGQITNIQLLDTGKYSVGFCVCPENETDFLLKLVSGKPDTETPKPWCHSMTIECDNDNFSMSPVDDEFVICMEVYDEHEFCDNLNPRLRRQWHTAYFADQLNHLLMKAGLLSMWTMVKKMSDGSTSSNTFMERIGGDVNKPETFNEQSESQSTENSSRDIEDQAVNSERKNKCICGSLIFEGEITRHDEISISYNGKKNERKDSVNNLLNQTDVKCISCGAQGNSGISECLGSLNYLTSGATMDVEPILCKCGSTEFTGVVEYHLYVAYREGSESDDFENECRLVTVDLFMDIHCMKCSKIAPFAVMQKIRESFPEYG